MWYLVYILKRKLENKRLEFTQTYKRIIYWVRLIVDKTVIREWKRH